MKKILITGHRGLLGNACVRHFKSRYQVVTSERTDLTQACAVYRMINVARPDIIIHCAAKVGGVKANRDYPVEFMLQNLRMQSNVMESAHDCGVQTLVHVATSCMFPKDAAMPVEETSLFTGKFEDSVEAYALAKICGWRLAKAFYEQYGRRYLTVAPSNIYGPGDSYSDQAHVIPSLIRRFNQASHDRKPLEVWGDGTAIREFIYSDDVASAIEAVIEKWDSPEVINIGTGKGTSIAELVSLISLTSPYRDYPEIIWNTDQPTGIPRKTFSIRKITSLGWNPSTDLEQGLRATWKDFLTNKPRGL